MDKKLLNIYRNALNCTDENDNRRELASGNTGG